jgi:hypothetical protein
VKDAVPPPHVQRLARTLIAWSADGASRAGDTAAGTDRLLDLVGASLGRLVGTLGYRMLLERALQRAARRVPLLSRASLPPPNAPSLTVLTPLLDGSSAADVECAGEALIAELVALLTRFLGIDVTRRVLLQALPDQAPDTIASLFRDLEDE